MVDVEEDATKSRMGVVVAEATVLNRGTASMVVVDSKAARIAVMIRECREDIAAVGTCADRWVVSSSVSNRDKAAL